MLSIRLHVPFRSNRIVAAVACAAIAAVAVLPLGFRAAEAAFPPPLVASHFAVATDHLDASRAAAEVMRHGGNAADGAIAAALALGVVNPSSSGLGGGGFATVCTPEGQCTFVDFRETSPAALTRERLQHAPAPATASQLGGLAVAVPAEPWGLLRLATRFGHLPLARVVAPAARLARDGFAVSSYLAMQSDHERANLARDTHLAALFLPGGQPVAEGARVRRPVLAATLERFGRGGAHFIQDEFARDVADAVRSAGGVITREDVAHDAVVERPPLTRPFRGFEIVTAPPPSAGGIIVLEALAFMDTMPAASMQLGSSAYDHALAEAFRSGFDDRARYVGDPGNSPSIAEALLDPTRLARRRAAFDPAHAGSVVVIEPAHDHGTTHICVADAQGMIVSLTTTVNLQFGARLSVPSLGVVLNDEIDDFSLGGASNNYGMAYSAVNGLAPGRRSVSSMSPTVVMQHGRPVGCVGASGGSRIPTATTEVLLNIMVHGLDVASAVAYPRVHHQGVPNRLLVDPEVPEDVRAALRTRGHDVAERDGVLAVAQAVWIRDEHGVRRIEAASDPRKQGQPAGE